MVQQSANHPNEDVSGTLVMTGSHMIFQEPSGRRETWVGCSCCHHCWWFSMVCSGGHMSVTHLHDSQSLLLASPPLLSLGCIYSLKESHTSVSITVNTLHCPTLTPLHPLQLGFHLIQSVTRLPSESRGHPLAIRCKHFLRLTFIIPSAEECSEVVETITALAQPGR